PMIKKHGHGGHVVNVASMASFITGPGFGVYATSKFAVRGLTESLRYVLGQYGIGVSLLCPGLTKSRIYEAPLHRPTHLSRSGVRLDEARIRELAAAHELGMDADEVGRKTLQGILRNDFYIFSHPEFRAEVREACDEVLRSLPDEETDFERMVYERARRKAKEQARALFDRLWRPGGCPDSRSADRACGLSREISRMGTRTHRHLLIVATAATLLGCAERAGD